jgi:hypothetical protein
LIQTQSRFSFQNDLAKTSGTSSWSGRCFANRCAGRRFRSAFTDRQACQQRQVPAASITIRIMLFSSIWLRPLAGAAYRRPGLRPTASPSSVQSCESLYAGEARPVGRRVSGISYAASLAAAYARAPAGDPRAAPASRPAS